MGHGSKGIHDRDVPVVQEGLMREARVLASDVPVPLGGKVAGKPSR